MRGLPSFFIELPLWCGITYGLVSAGVSYSQPEYWIILGCAIVLAVKNFFDGVNR